MSVFELAAGHEQVVFAQDSDTGLRAIIALHSTALGPALGGTRFYPYADDGAALVDVLRLSRGMTYKAACADLPLGGGKAVVIGDPTILKTDALLRAYGRVVERLGGHYITAGDVGTSALDMDVVATQTSHVAGKTAAAGGSGDTSYLTAFGVVCGLRAPSKHVWGDDSLAGKRVAVSGLGKVGRHLVGLLVAAEADVMVADVAVGAVDAVMTSSAAREGSVVVVDPSEIASLPVDIYSPCAMGGVLSGETIGRLKAAVVCGAANNQLADPIAGQLLRDRGICYAPDYVVNAGGLIQAHMETQGHDAAVAQQSVEGIVETLQLIFHVADELGSTTSAAADLIAEERIRGFDRRVA